MTTAMKASGQPELARYQQKIVEAMAALPDGITPREISRGARFTVTTRDLNDMVKVGVVVESDSPDPPFKVYSLASEWRTRLDNPVREWMTQRVSSDKLRTDIQAMNAGTGFDLNRLAQRHKVLPDTINALIAHYGLQELTKAEPVTKLPAPPAEDTVEALTTRVGREALQVATAARRGRQGPSIAAIASRFDITPAQTKVLIDHYGLWGVQNPDENEGQSQAAAQDPPAPRQPATKEAKPMEQEIVPPEPAMEPPATDMQHGATQRPRVIIGEKKTELLGKFNVGLGETRDDRRKLATQFGVDLHAIENHYHRWRKGRPPAKATTSQTEPPTPEPVQPPALRTIEGEAAPEWIERQELSAAREQALVLVTAHQLDPVHYADLVERIRMNGAAETTEEMAKDMADFAKLRAGAGNASVREKTQAADRPGPEEGQAMATAEICRPEAELMVARQERDAAYTQWAEAVRANGELAAQWGDLLDQTVTGICATCIHHIDRMCPYSEDWMAATHTIPDEELPPRHQGQVITYGRRPVTSCTLHRPERAG